MFSTNRLWDYDTSKTTCLEYWVERLDNPEYAFSSNNKNAALKEESEYVESLTIISAFSIISPSTGFALYNANKAVPAKVPSFISRALFRTFFISNSSSCEIKLLFVCRFSSAKPKNWIA
mgnify:CR=1 FL=1